MEGKKKNNKQLKGNSRTCSTIHRKQYAWELTENLNAAVEPDVFRCKRLSMSEKMKWSKWKVVNKEYVETVCDWMESGSK